jgi:hypothetical protein
MIPVVGLAQGGKSQKRQIKKTSGLGGGEQLGGNQGGQGVFLGAEALEQHGLFLCAEAVPYVDHLQGSVEHGGVWGVGHEGVSGSIQAVWKALKAALSTRSGTASVLAFAVDWFGFFGLRLLVAGLLRCWLLSFVQAWEGEIRYLVHRRRSSQGLFFSIAGDSALSKSLGRIQHCK